MRTDEAVILGDPQTITAPSRRLSTNIARIREYLAKANEVIKKGKARIKKREERVKKLASDGHQANIAEEILQDFQQLLGTMKKHSHLVRWELKKSSKKLVTASLKNQRFFSKNGQRERKWGF